MRKGFYQFIFMYSNLQNKINEKTPQLGTEGIRASFKFFFGIFIKVTNSKLREDEEIFPLPPCFSRNSKERREFKK